MEPLSTILTALVAGAAASAKDTTSNAIKDAYTGLKSLIKKKFGDNTMASNTLEEHAKDSETWEKPLTKALNDSEADKDQEIIEAAKALLEQTGKLDSGKYNVNIQGNVSGMVQGDNANVTMNFGSSEN